MLPHRSPHRRQYSHTRSKGRRQRSAPACTTAARAPRSVRKNAQKLHDRSGCCYHRPRSVTPQLRRSTTTVALASNMKTSSASAMPALAALVAVLALVPGGCGAPPHSARARPDGLPDDERGLLAASAFYAAGQQAERTPKHIGACCTAAAPAEAAHCGERASVAAMALVYPRAAARRPI